MKRLLRTDTVKMQHRVSLRTCTGKIRSSAVTHTQTFTYTCVKCTHIPLSRTCTGKIRPSAVTRTQTFTYICVSNSTVSYLHRKNKVKNKAVRCHAHTDVLIYMCPRPRYSYLWLRYHSYTLSGGSLSLGKHYIMIYQHIMTVILVTLWHITISWLLYYDILVYYD